MNLFTIPICLTHRCNLNCIYCFQTHDNQHEMTYETGKTCIDWIFNNILFDQNNHAEITFFGGEPLLRFELIKKLFQYVLSKSKYNNFNFFVVTNGTLLSDDMKEWFHLHKDIITLGLSLDGGKETQDVNRSNSFDFIDFEYFRSNWPKQHVKMTVSKQSIYRYAKDVKFIHSLGFGINGADLCLGSYNWSSEEYIKIMAPQLQELVDYYIENPDCYNVLFKKDLASCAVQKIRKKNCGCGDKVRYFDTDGKMYPCTYLTPMSFSSYDIDKIMKYDFCDVKSFVDEECFNNCYIYQICKTCHAEDYLVTKTFCHYDKSKCEMRYIEAIVLAEYNARLISQNPHVYNDTKLYYTIEAIKKIKELYWPQYKMYFKNMEVSENP